MFCRKCGKIITEGNKYCKFCGDKVFFQVKRKKRSKIVLILLSFGAVTVLVLSGLFVFSIFSLFHSHDETYIDFNVAASVVNINCDSELYEDTFGGSGTIISEEGLILTNSHIIPRNETGDDVASDIVCIITLPNPETGEPEEIYYADPIVFGDISDKYDIAFLEIQDVYFDDEEQIYYGEYPKKFPSYIELSESDTQCSEDMLLLGEQIKIYGYPSLSGGYYLTVTEGLISSINFDEDLIITSAKVSYGNSGGLAIDKDGCFVGIPSSVLGDDNESFGVIIPGYVVMEFLEKISE